MGSGGGGGSGNPAMLMQNAAPMGGLPIAGKDSGAVSDPFDYGKFQNFLPDATAAGTPPNIAHGLTPDMFKYRSPGGIVDPGSGGGGAGSSDNTLRDALAKLVGGSGGGTPYGDTNTPGDPNWKGLPYADPSLGMGAAGGGGGGGGMFGGGGGGGPGGGGGFSRMNLPTGGGTGDQAAMQKQLDAFLASTGGNGANWDYGKARGASDPYNYAGYGIAHPVGGDPSFGQVNSSTMPGLIAQPSIGWDPNSPNQPSLGYTPPKPPGT